MYGRRVDFRRAVAGGEPEGCPGSKLGYGRESRQNRVRCAESERAHHSQLVRGSDEVGRWTYLTRGSRHAGLLWAGARAPTLPAATVELGTASASAHARARVRGEG